MNVVALWAIVVSAAAGSLAAPSEDTLRALQSETAEAPLADRLERLTKPFLGLPYGLSPLGEGEGVDTDPRLRWDVFDCLTFVETAMALVAAPTFDDVLPVLDHVRYGASPSFVNRNHFVESQWLPSNVLKGYVRDISAEVAGNEVVVVRKEFGPERWAARGKLASMALAVDDIPRGSFAVPTVPLEVARRRISSIPSGTLLFVVREDFYTQPTRVTHVGLVVGEGKNKMLRHAAGKPYNRVIDEPLSQFFARNARYSKWPVTGVAVYRIEAPTAQSVSTLRLEP